MGHEIYIDAEVESSPQLEERLKEAILAALEESLGVTLR